MKVLELQYGKWKLTMSFCIPHPIPPNSFHPLSIPSPRTISIPIRFGKYCYDNNGLSIAGCWLYFRRPWVHTHTSRTATGS